MKERASHGSGSIDRSAFRRLGQGVVFERGALVFHAENVEIGDHVYVGHYAILKGYHRNLLSIGSGTWIGQAAFLHAAGGITIGESVGIGPGVHILTSAHEEAGRSIPILEAPLRFAPVRVDAGADLGIGSIILPGVHIGQGAQVAAGAVVTRNVPAYAVVAGVPARKIRMRPARPARGPRGR